MADPNLRCQVANATVAALPPIPDGTCSSDIAIDMADVMLSTHFKANKDMINTLVHPEEEKGGEGKQLPERQSWRCRFGPCFTLTMSGWSRNRPSSCGRLWG